MKTTKSKSGVSDLILACFILSVFLLLENKKESERNDAISPTSSEVTLHSSLDHPNMTYRNYFNSIKVK